MRHRYLVVEGPIGVGKTSLAGLLASKLDAELVLEDVDNPFLREFYEDRARVSFQTQVFFLLARHRQQERVRQRSLFQPVMVSDYLFAKDKVFAHLNLSDDELALYERLYALLSEAAVEPDLVLYLQASTDVLLRRIELRAREFERRIARAYVEAVNEAYNYFFYHYRKTPLLVVNTDRIDFVRRPHDLDDLVKQVSIMEVGTRYFVPAPSGD